MNYGGYGMGMGMGVVGMGMGLRVPSCLVCRDVHHFWSSPLPWVCLPHDAIQNLWNNEHPPMFAVRQAPTISKRNHTVQLRYALGKEAYALHGADTCCSQVYE